MNHRTSVLGIAITACLIFISSAQGSIVTIAENPIPVSPTSWFHVGAGVSEDGLLFDNRVAQTFRSTEDAYAGQIFLSILRTEDTNAALRIAITTIIGGQPGNVLGSRLINAESFPVGNFPGAPTFNTIVNFGSLGIPLWRDQSFALVFSTDGPEANYRIHGNDANYSNGELLRFQNNGPYVPMTGSDLFFVVNGTPIPEASSLVLLAACGMIPGIHALKGWRRRTVSGD